MSSRGLGSKRNEGRNKEKMMEGKKKKRRKKGKKERSTHIPTSLNSLSPI